MSTLEQRQIISRLNRINLERAEYSELVNLMRVASKGTRVYIQERSNELFFRGRISQDQRPSAVADLAAPPARLVTGFQRCNPPGVAMFYCASKRITALLECNVQAGDIVTLGQWMCSDLAPVNRVLSQPELDSAVAAEQVFHTFLETIFTRPIHATFANAYKLTAAATEVLTTNFFNSSDPTKYPGGLIGLSYPSVANIDGGYNTVFHADFVERKFVLLHATRLKVIERSGENLEVEIVDTAREVVNGQLVWSDDVYSIPTPIVDRNALPFISNGRNWLVPVYERALSRDDLQLFLHE